LWFLPPTGSAASAQGKPYLGWSAEELPSADWSNIHAIVDQRPVWRCFFGL
jgi:hypothetical protein